MQKCQYYNKGCLQYTFFGLEIYFKVCFIVKKIAFFFFSLYHNIKRKSMASAHPDYDQYTDQLLNSVFENIKQTSEEDQFVNQLLQNLKLSNQTPPVNNDVLLLQQQLQQQKELLEKLTSNIHATPTTSNSSFQVPTIAEPPASDQKIPRVPVQNKQDLTTGELKDINTASKTTSVASPPPVLERKKSFIQRALSRDKQFKGKLENKSKSKETSAPQIQRGPSFWRPREERPKGWWKGNTHQPIQGEESFVYYDDDSSDFEQDEDEEEVVDVPPPQMRKKKRQQQTVVTRKAIEPKKVTSIKKQRQMAFKTPTLKKKSKATLKKNQKSAAASTVAPVASPVYVMPQQPIYYQQPMMVPQQPYMGGNGYYYPMGYTQPTYASPTTTTNASSTTEVTRKKANPSVFNPREATHDKCTIM